MLSECAGCRNEQYGEECFFYPPKGYKIGIITHTDDSPYTSHKAIKVPKCYQPSGRRHFEEIRKLRKRGR